MDHCVATIRELSEKILQTEENANCLLELQEYLAVGALPLGERFCIPSQLILQQ